MSCLIDIKPLSVNDCWQGRRFKTKEYKSYENDLLRLLPKKIDMPDGNLWLKIRIGVSNKNSDVDNILKPFIDILQKKYKFNDKRIYRLSIIKDDVKKGKEYIKFEFFKEEL